MVSRTKCRKTEEAAWKKYPKGVPEGPAQGNLQGIAKSCILCHVSYVIVTVTQMTLDVCLALPNFLAMLFKTVFMLKFDDNRQEADNRKMYIAPVRLKRPIGRFSEKS